jgi:hypothetical protein
MVWMSRGVVAPLVVSGFVAMAAMGAAGCEETRPRRPQTAADLTIPPIGGGAAPSVKTAHGDMTTACTASLEATSIEKSTPSCYVDEKISDGPGVLRYPCSGDGPAEATFGDQRYEGRVTRGEIELSLSTELDWDDGCRWGTHAVIHGPLTDGTRLVHAKLSWDYLDRVLQGTGCSGVCRARASFSVSEGSVSGGAAKDATR